MTTTTPGPFTIRQSCGDSRNWIIDAGKIERVAIFKNESDARRFAGLPPEENTSGLAAEVAKRAAAFVAAYSDGSVDFEPAYEALAAAVRDMREGAPA